MLIHIVEQRIYSQKLVETKMSRYRRVHGAVAARCATDTVAARSPSESPWLRTRHYTKSNRFDLFMGENAASLRKCAAADVTQRQDDDDSVTTWSPPAHWLQLVH
ncbi:hypothetical protein F2P81_014598 [Scophthalmus maximus]|uniref:Uncharacterized protein n=1 Tax=Scophthalmus maximus TaxID=52904 RepID=A0A6A4SJH7_SCOMX|nr:hypothetical protein F2P81_014598 [Scophthalmus maximus]